MQLQSGWTCRSRWYRSEPRLPLNRSVAVVLRYQLQLEGNNLAPATINTIETYIIIPREVSDWRTLARHRRTWAVLRGYLHQ